MSSWYDAKHDILKLRCDGCGMVVSTFEGQTDRLLNNEYIKENGWMTIKRDKWYNLCPRCKQAMEDKKRLKWLESI